MFPLTPSNTAQTLGLGPMPHSGHLPDVQRVCRPPAADAGGGDRRLPRAGTESQESSRSGALARPIRALAAGTRGCAPANEGAPEWHT